MPLKVRVLLIVVALFAAYTAVQIAIQKGIIQPRFVELERAEAARDLSRGVEALEQELQRLDLQCLDWAAWDETYAFALGRNDAYRHQYLLPDAFQEMRVNLWCVVDPDGRIIWGDARRIDTLARFELAELHGDAKRELQPLLEHPGPMSVITGVWSTSAGPMLTASRPVVTNMGGGPIAGTLVVGRLLDDALVDEIESRTHLALQVEPFEAGQSGLPSEDWQTTIRFEEMGEGTLRVSAVYPDFRGAPALGLTADIPRTMLAESAATLRYATLSLLGAGTLSLIVLWLLLHRAVVRPLLKLTHGVTAIAHDEDLTRRVEVDRSDELGTLAREFNRMIGRLSDTRKRLEHNARHDALTGLPNRAHILDAIDACFEQSRREPYRFAVLFIDLNKFKPVNDELGHDVGDELLKAIAERLREGLRHLDVVVPGDHVAARLGGDEFVVLFDRLRHAADASIVAKRIREDLDEPFRIGPHTVQCGGSIGIATSDDGFETTDELLKAADEAMYRAKSTGAGIITFADTDPDVRAA